MAAAPPPAYQPGDVQWSWVDFSLGEDVRNEARLEQDARWKQAIADGRAHVSVREYASKHAEEFIDAVEDYGKVKMLVTASFTDKKNVLAKLNGHVELLRHIVDLAMPGQGPLVFALADELEKKRAAAAEAESKPTADDDAAASSFRLCARCRPLMPWELENGAYSCAALFPASAEIVLHDGKMARNGRRLTMTHKKYAMSRVWPHHASNTTVCVNEVDPLLARARAGFAVSLLCFGQTGTGKTYTLLAALDHTLKELERDGRNIELTFFELHGKKAYDLLSQRKLVHLRSDENEVVHVRGATSVVVLAAPAAATPQEPAQPATKDEGDAATNADDDAAAAAAAASWKNSTATVNSYASLWSMLDSAFELRSSEVTERNPVSSRSHAVCVIKLLPSDAHAGAGKMTFVDLAGSERNYETTKMTPAQHRESADINYSLMALKDCFRAYHAVATGAKMMLRRRRVDCPKSSSSFAMIKPEDAFAPARAPYRASLLTRVLRECFVNCASAAADGAAADSAEENETVDRRHYTTIITTLSPTPVDIMHGINSLEHVVLMQPDLVPKMSAVTVEVPLKGVALSHLPIETWSAEQVVSWLATAGNGRFAQLALPPGLDGAGLMKLNMVSLSALFEGHLRAARQGEEGSAWVVDAASEGRHNYLGRALWAALRREQVRQRATVSADAGLTV